MGHMIQCFIGQPLLIEKIISPLKPLKITIVDLPQELQCLFLCDNLLDSIHSYQQADDNTCIEPFEFLSVEIKSYLEDIKPDGEFVYIETEYFGGQGGQSSGIFKNGKLIEAYKENTSDIDGTIPYPDRLLNSPVNKALRRLGVVRKTKCDEFETLELEEYRHMPHNEIL